MVEPVTIIAEIGVNHNGNVELAKKMVLEAKKSGADIVKFQTAKPEALLTKYAHKAKYQIETTGNDASQLEMIKEVILSYDEFEELQQFCKKQDICFLSTPFDIQSIEFLEKFDMPFWKIPSGEITNYPYLVEIGKTQKKVVMSTGMSNIDEIAEAIAVLKDNGTKEIVLLQCNTQYPTKCEDVNLNVMRTLRDIFGVEVGYSDHTKGIEIPIAAVALGARIIEKHFTLDCTMEGPDHKASIEPQEFAQMVYSIRNVEKALGNSEKKVTESERENIYVARKSIVAACDIKEGEILNANNLTTKRPGTGMSPMKWECVLGKCANRDYCADEMIDL